VSGAVASWQATVWHFIAHNVHVRFQGISGSPLSQHHYLQGSLHYGFGYTQNMGLQSFVDCLVVYTTNNNDLYYYHVDFCEVLTQYVDKHLKCLLLVESSVC